LYGIVLVLTVQGRLLYALFMSIIYRLYQEAD